MADRVLPSRDEVQHSNLDIAEPAYSIVAAYLDDELKTEAEWMGPATFEKMAGQMAQAMDRSEWFTKRYAEAERLLAAALEDL